MARTNLASLFDVTWGGNSSNCGSLAAGQDDCSGVRGLDLGKPFLSGRATTNLAPRDSARSTEHPDWSAPPSTAQRKVQLGRQALLNGAHSHALSETLQRTPDLRGRSNARTMKRHPPAIGVGSRLPFQPPKVSLCDFCSAQSPSRSQRQRLSRLLFQTGRHC